VQRGAASATKPQVPRSPGPPACRPGARLAPALRRRQAAQGRPPAAAACVPPTHLLSPLKDRPPAWPSGCASSASRCRAVGAMTRLFTGRSHRPTSTSKSSPLTKQCLRQQRGRGRQ
jgi:hypothetical protein